MTNDFAAAMRRAALSTRAYDVVEATRIIQDALVRQAGVGTYHAPGPDLSSRESKSRPALRLIDPNAEIIEPIQSAGALNRQPWWIAKAITASSQAAWRGAADPSGRPAVYRGVRISDRLGVPPNQTALSAAPHCRGRPICDSVFCRRGGGAKLQALYSGLRVGALAWPHCHAAWLQAEPGRFFCRHRHERRRRGAWSHRGLP